MRRADGAVTDDYGSPVVMIEWSPKGRLHSVVCVSAMYDFEWSNRYGGALYHLSGFGAVAPAGQPLHVSAYMPGVTGQRLWVADGYTTADGAGRPAHDIGYVVDGGACPLDPFDDATESRAEYCGKCRDWLLEMDECEHLEWCDRHGEYRGSGAYDPCCGPAARAKRRREKRAQEARAGREGGDRG